ATVLLQTVAGSVRDAFATFFARLYPSDGIVLVAGTGFLVSGPGRGRLRLSYGETVAGSVAVERGSRALLARYRDVQRAGSGGDQDSTIWVPYTTLMETMLKRNTVTQATFILRDRSQVESAHKEITDIMRQRHQIGEGQDDDFSVITASFIADQFEQSYKTV